MTFTERLRALDILGGQRAPRASSGSGFQILHHCPVCHRVWLRDGRTDILDLRSEQIQHLAQQLSADLLRLPKVFCRMCLWRTGHGAVEIDQYESGEGFGFCWEIPKPLVLHATCALLSPLGRLNPLSLPEILTQFEKLRAVLQAMTEVSAPQQIDLIDPSFCALQSTFLAPGFGQAGTEQWQWQGCSFHVSCPPFHGDTTVTFLLALPPTEVLSPNEAFAIWQKLMEVTRLGGIPKQV